MTHAGGPDCSTPLLMQFLRLPLDDPARAGDILSRFLHGREPMTEGMPELPLALGTNELRDAQEAQALARRVLTAVAENLPIRTRDLAEIEGAAQRFDRRLGYTHAHITVTDVSGELALLTEAVLPQTVFLAHDGLPVQRLLADVFRELKYALGAHLLFRVCNVCGVLHRDDRYTPHICLGPVPRSSEAEETPALVRPLPRTPADEPGAEIPEEETIYGVVTDPVPSSLTEVETTHTGTMADAESTGHGYGRFDRHGTLNGGVRYAPMQPSPDTVSPPAKQRPHSEKAHTTAGRNARAGKDGQPSAGASHPGAAYWKDQQTI